MNSDTSILKVLSFLSILTLAQPITAGVPLGSTLRVKPIHVGIPSNAPGEFNCSLADQIFGQIGIHVQAEQHEFLYVPDPRAEQTSPYFSEEDMLVLLGAYTADEADCNAIPVFYVGAIEDNLPGVTYPPALAATLGVHPGVFLSIRDHYLDTLAHELGHFMLDHWRFVQDPNDPYHVSDPNALMASDAIRHMPDSADAAVPHGDMGKITFSLVESVDALGDSRRVSQIEAMRASSYLQPSMAYYDDFHMACNARVIEENLPETRQLNDDLEDCEVEWGVRTPLTLVEERIDEQWGTVEVFPHAASVAICPRFTKDTSGQDYLEVMYDISLAEPYEFAVNDITVLYSIPEALDTNLYISTYLQGWLIDGIELSGRPETVDLLVAADMNVEQRVEVSHSLLAPEVTWLRDANGSIAAMPLELQILNTDLQGARRIIWRYWRAPILCTSCYESRG